MSTEKDGTTRTEADLTDTEKEILIERIIDKLRIPGSYWIGYPGFKERIETGEIVNSTDEYWLSLKLYSDHRERIALRKR